MSSQCTRSFLIWLPTGFGKSLCYEVLLFMLGDKLDREDSLVTVDTYVSSNSSYG